METNKHFFSSKMNTETFDSVPTSYIVDKSRDYNFSISMIPFINNNSLFHAILLKDDPLPDTYEKAEPVPFSKAVHKAINSKKEFRCGESCEIIDPQGKNHFVVYYMKTNTEVCPLRCVMHGP